jgi:hypothetical protein
VSKEVAGDGPGRKCPGQAISSGTNAAGEEVCTGRDGGLCAELTAAERGAIERFLAAPGAAAGGPGRARTMALAALKFAGALLLAAGVVAGYADGDDLDEVGCTVAHQPDGDSDVGHSARTGERGGGKVAASGGAGCGGGDGASGGTGAGTEQRATPGQQSAAAEIAGGRDHKNLECGPAGAAVVEAVEAALKRFERKFEGLVERWAGAGGERVLVEGRLRYLTGMEDVWLGSIHYDLRSRDKARLCLEYLVRKKAFDSGSARNLVDEIDPYVREKGRFPRAAEVKIGDYFSDRTGRLRALRRDLIGCTGRNGRYFLKVN